MGKILRTVNLIVNALKPKQVTWSLNEDGTGYIAEEKEMENKFDIELVNPTTEELEIPFETYLTSSGIPWSGPKKEIKPLINNTSLANPKLPIEEPEDQKIDELKIIRTMQETLTSKLKIEKIVEKKCQAYISSLKNSRFTREELAREKKADLEMRRRLLIHLEELKPKKQIEKEPKMNILSSEKCRFTREELAREKKADLETRKRLQAFLEKIKTKKEKDIATLFDPVQGAEYYLNRYNSEPAFKAWFDTNFKDHSIEEILELAIPVTFSKSKSQSKLDLHYKNSDLQKYIDIYNNEPMYKDWFDRKYPGHTIYDIIGIPEPHKPNSYLSI
jgi:hypothetical protein